MVSKAAERSTRVSTITSPSAVHIYHVYIYDDCYFAFEEVQIM